ncbi:MAG: RNA-directed DNA polymerase [Minicystis sp.]
MKVSPSDLFLAYRQAKAAMFYEQRGVGLVEIAKFEQNLPQHLAGLHEHLTTSGNWFDDVPIGSVWVVPKSIRGRTQGLDEVIRIGGKGTSEDGLGLNVQLRCTPSPEFTIIEVLYLWKFGPLLERLLARNVVGYRLDIRKDRVRPFGRWLFEYWPSRYQEFRTAPLRAARRALSTPNGSVTIVTADFASFYDTVDPSFLTDPRFVGSIDFASTTESSIADAMRAEYLAATESLLRAYSAYREKAAQITGLPWPTGVPIGTNTSRIVANLALATFDAHIKKNEKVLCYRRYVDDFVVVARSSPDEKVTFESALEPLIPRPEKGETLWKLNGQYLERPGSEFQLQLKKVCVHHLSGIQGRDFVEAVTGDFNRLVSERRSFLDQGVLLERGATHLVRVSKSEGSPLRVLRDADRTRLERFALSTHLRSLDRISSLVSRNDARRQVRQTLETVVRVLDGNENWVENLDLVLRLLRLAISTNDSESSGELLERTERMWGSLNDLKKTVAKLYHRDREVGAARAWIWLRNYLHERRLEAICTSLPSDVERPEVSAWLMKGVTFYTENVGLTALRRRAQLLAASDLRTRDREDDAFGPNRFDTRDQGWMRSFLGQDSEMLARLDAIKSFTQLRSQEVGGPWGIAPARLFLCTRPPSYLDVARRWMAFVERDGFDPDVFKKLLHVVNAIRGTSYQDPLGVVQDKYTVCIPGSVNSTEEGELIDPRLILANLVTQEDPHWVRSASRVEGSSHGNPELSLSRLRGLAAVLRKSNVAAQKRSPSGRPPSLLVLPEMSIPRAWFRTVANYVVGLNRHGLIAGVEYEHHSEEPFVENQVHAVFPGPFLAAASWRWTKEFPAHEEGLKLRELRVPVAFPAMSSARLRTPRTVVRTVFGDLSVLICSELLEAHRVADLLGRVELVLVPSWNTDTASYDHLIQSVGMHLHAVVAVANNGHFSDCRAWAPRQVRWERDLCRLIERNVNSIVTVELPLRSLRDFRAAAFSSGSAGAAANKEWRPLPPGWR